MELLRRIWSRPAGALGILFVFALLYWGGEHLRRELWAPDEARFAYVAKEMREEGHWLVPHRNGEYYAHKPPLMFWLINASASLLAGGEINSWTTRFPSLLGAVATLWSVVMLMRLWNRGRDDAAAALICAATYLVYKEGGWGQIDMLLCGLEMLALLALFSQDAKASSGRAFLAYLCMGLAVLAKGPVGFLVPLLAYLTAKIAARETTDLRRWHWVWGPFVALALPGVWLALVALNHPPAGYLDELLFSQNIDRAQGEFGHREPFYYFLTYFPLDGLPWAVLLPFAWMALGENEEDRALRRRLTGWMVLVIVFFSLSPSKRNLYILLAYPALALFVASAWRGFRETSHLVRVRRALSWFPPILVGVLLVIVLASPFLPGLVESAGSGEKGSNDVLLETLETLRSIPFLTAVPGLVVALVCMAASHFLTKPHPHAPWRLASLWAILFATIGGTLLPLFNDHKTPKELIPLADSFIPEGGRLYLYRLNGENLALYTGRRGQVLHTADELVEVMGKVPTGLIVFEHRVWEEMKEGLGAGVTPHPFRLGGKHLIAAHWGGASEGAIPR